MVSPTHTRAQTLVVSSPGDAGGVLRVRKTKLLVISGKFQGREFLISKDVFSIGSGLHNDLRLDDSTVSKRHCEIRVDESGYSIHDLGSTNGTHVQGLKVQEASLDPGAELQLGKTRLIFCPLQEARELPLSSRESFGKMLGTSVSMRRIFYMAETYATTEATIMITGETGTGKEILAEEIHKHSSRHDKPFVVIDCASLAKDLIESELFGHSRGAFTGATSDRAGAFEQADGGTVFLDEIGDLSPTLQPKLLRVLENREIRRVGSNTLRKINVRIICATNRRMDIEVNEGRFREDLFYRLSVVPIDLPPLRNRRDDIPLLVRNFIVEFHGEAALDELADFDSTMEVLKRHAWPGNVRELRNLVELAFYSKARPVDLAAFMSLRMFSRIEADRPEDQEPALPGTSAERPFKEVKSELIADFEREYIVNLLARNKGNVSRSAREAGIERAYLQRLMKKHALRDSDD